MRWINHKRAYPMLLIAATLLAYVNMLGNDFVWDDEMLVVNNSYIRNPSYILPSFLTDLFHADASWAVTHYRPMQTLSYLFDYYFWGLNPFGYHLTNLLLHLGCVLLVYTALRRFFQDIDVAFAAALLFLVHPVNTNAITYIAGRADPLAFLWMLASLLLVDQYRRVIRRTSAPAILLYAAAMICFVAALFSRESALVFPAIVAIYCRFVTPSPKRRWPEALASALPFLLMAIAFIALRQLVLSSESGLTGNRWALPVMLRIQIPFRALATYVGLLAWPARLQIERQLIFGSAFLPLLTGLGVAAFAGLACCGFWACRRSTTIAFGIAWFFLTMTPLLGILDLNATIAEHWLYVPSIGLYLAAAALLNTLKLPNRLTAAVFAAVVLALMARTVARNTTWATPEKFYAATTKDAPYSAAALANLSSEQLHKHQTDVALTNLLMAVRMAPNYPSARLKLAAAYYFRGDVEHADQQIRQCLAISPQNTSALLLAADIAEERGSRLDAKRHLLAALGTTAGPLPRLRYGEFLLRHGESAAALDIAREALKLEPGNAPLHNLTGIVLAETGDYDGALKAFRQAQQMDRHSPDAWTNLARLAMNRGNDAEAESLFRQALLRAPDNLPALYQLASLHCMLGQRNLALEELARAQQVGSENSLIHAAIESLQRGGDCPELRKVRSVAGLTLR